MALPPFFCGGGIGFGLFLGVSSLNFRGLVEESASFSDFAIQSIANGYGIEGKGCIEECY